MLATEPSRRCAPGALGLILALTAALYAPSLRNGFTYDDAYVAASTHPSGQPNPLIAESQPLLEYFRSHYWKGEHEARVEYRPVTILSYAWTYRAFGRSAAAEALPQHALNVLLHLLATALVYRLVRAARARRSAALLAALVFGVHAVHSEVVASVVGRAELLAFSFGALALLLALGQGRGCVWRGAAAALCLFLAFGAKESALAWVAFMIAMGLVRALRSNPTRSVAAALAVAAWRAALVAVVPLAAFLALRAAVLAALPEPPPVASFDANPLAYVPWLERVLSALMIQGVALGKILLPLHLASDYGRAVFELLRSPLDPRFLLAAAALTALAVAGLASIRRAPPLFLAAVAFLGFGFPTSNLLVPIGTIFAERLLYAPSLGLSFALAAIWGALAGSARWRRIGFALVLALWLCLCGALILQRNAAWRSNAALYTTDADSQPRSVKLNVLAADVYRERGETERQFEHLARAFAFDRQPARSWLRLALHLLQQRSWSEAEEAARRGAEAATGRAVAYRFQLAWVRAESLRASGRAEPAVPLWDELVDEYWRLVDSPHLVDVVLNAPPGVGPEARAWADVAAALEARGELAAAEDALQLGLAACRWLPPERRFPLHWQLAALFGNSGRFDQMAAQLASARSADPQRYEQMVGALAPGDPRRAD
jgi:hypothetical protein